MLRPTRSCLVGGILALACLAAPTAAQAGTLSASTSPLYFSTQVVGNGSNWQHLTLNNDTTDTHISSLSFGGLDAGEFQLFNDNCSGRTLNASGSCGLDVQWNPQTPGVKSAHLDVANDGSVNLLSVAIDATALGGPRPTLSPSALSFPDTMVGGAHQQTVTVTNTGDTALQINGMFIVTGTPQVWPISSDGCSGQQGIAPDANCQFTVGFQPIAAGSKEATLFLITNSPRLGVTLLPMGGVGTAPAPPTTPVTPVSPVRPASNLFTIVGRALDTTKGRATLTVNVPGPGRLDGVATATAAQLATKGHNHGGAPIVVVRARVTSRGAGRVKLVVSPSTRAKTILKKRGSLHVRVKITYTPTGGSARTKTIGLTLKLNRPGRHH